MRLSRFYIPEPLSSGEFQLPEAQAHYISRVLRLTEGSTIQLFDGSGWEYPGELVEVGKKQVRVLLQDAVAGLPESPLHIHLGQGLSRGEKMDWVIQKATELGAQAITPLFTERCEVKLQGERQDKRMEHWQQIAISACEQCGRTKPPVIHAPQRLDDWLKTVEADLKLVLDPQQERALGEHSSPKTLAMLIGPEGGLSGNEVEAAKVQNFQGTLLGPRVLRTETAPIAMISVAQWLWGDWRG